jgi:Yip1 domain
MSRIAGLVVAVIGLLMLLATAVLKIIGLGDPGLLVIVVGLVIFGLGFIRRPAADPEAPPPLAPAERLTGIFISPARVFANLRFHPRWLLAFVVAAIFMVAYQSAFTRRVTPTRIASEGVDRAVERGFIAADLAPEYKERQLARAVLPGVQIGLIVRQLCGYFMLMLLVAALLFLCVLIADGELNFWQALAITTYSSLPPVVLTSIISLILLYVQAPESIDVVRGQHGLTRADLGLLVAQTNHPFLYVIASAIGIFTFYGWWLTVKGLRHTATRVSNVAAWSIALGLWALGIIAVLGLTALFPALVS